MSYQVKSTPFFRRLVLMSKRNGQLQKLKEEYEKIKEFSERTIDKKMRQVRLKHFLREIDGIQKTKPSQRRISGNSSSNDKIKTSDDVRVQTMIKARELGKEYSKLNAVYLDRSGSKIESPKSLLNMESNINSDNERKARSVMRISYGNDISKYNIHKIGRVLQKKRSNLPANGPTCSFTVAQTIDNHKKKEVLQKRLSYGNARSDANMSKIHKIQKKQKTPDVDIQEDTKNLPRDNLSISESQTDTIVELSGYNIEKQSTIDSCIVLSSEDEAQRLLTLQRWRNLKLIFWVAFGFMKERDWNKPKIVIYTKMADDSFQSNSSESLKSMNSPQSSMYCNHGLLIEPAHKEEVTSDKTSVNDSEEASLSESDTAFSNSDAKPDTVDINQEIQSNQVRRYVEFFEPIVREAAQREAYQIGMELCEILENKN